MNKLDKPTQYRWFYFQVARPRQTKTRAFRDWLDFEAKVAVKHRHNVIAAGYHDKQRAQEDSEQIESASATEQEWEARAYSVKAGSGEVRCPACASTHNLEGSKGEIRASTRLADCAQYIEELK